MADTELQDAIIRHALDLQRLSANDEAEAIAVLQQLEDELRTLLASRALTEADRKTINDLIGQAEDVIQAKYGVVSQVVDTQGIIALVGENTAQALQAMAPSIGRLSQARIDSLTREVLIDGAPSSAWWAKQAEDVSFKFAAAIRQGVVNGETQERIVARITGKEGFLETSWRGARALVHSSVMTAANAARLATYRKNAKYLDGVKWLATLDSHTCLQCATLDGAIWDLDGKPIRGTKMTFQLPPAHWNCRCVASPATKSWARITGNSALDDLQASLSRRVSSNGAQSGSTTFKDFLQRQSPAFVEDVLGKKRAEMYLAGNLTLADLVNGRGRPLTLAELKAR